ncbi:hypothetical protein A5662_05700 [Mycobacteriaceae bacterium 1482268.1]|nr:hypothetical protein A5662_05700 [Mycobacteriaceae bacterium 1482268.1]
MVALSSAWAASAEPVETPPRLPEFVPHASEWTPDYTPFPYNLWQPRVTREQVTAERDACQWFNAQYHPLMGQVSAFQRELGDQHDDWTANGIQVAADVLTANLYQSAAFLDPRVHTLFITNYPDQSEYSPLYNGDSFYHLWYQLTQISDKTMQNQPSGFINANIATAYVYGRVIRDSGVCDGA